MQDQVIRPQDLYKRGDCVKYEHDENRLAKYIVMQVDLRAMPAKVRLTQCGTGITRVVNLEDIRFA